MFVIQLLKAGVEDLKPDVDTVNKQAQDLITAGLGLDSAVVKQMSDTDKQWNDVKDAAANQQAEIEKALQEVEELQEALQRADQAMTESEEKVKQLPPVGADVDTINQQLEGIKVWASIFSTLFSPFFEGYPWGRFCEWSRNLSLADHFLFFS